jgi:hypothetical protein
LDRRLVRPESWSGRCEENILAIPGIEPGPSSPYPVAVSTELIRFLLIGLRILHEIKTKQIKTLRNTIKEYETILYLYLFTVKGKSVPFLPLTVNQNPSS